MRDICDYYAVCDNFSRYVVYSHLIISIVAYVYTFMNVMDVWFMLTTNFGAICLNMINSKWELVSQAH